MADRNVYPPETEGSSSWSRKIPRLTKPPVAETLKKLGVDPNGGLPSPPSSASPAQPIRTKRPRREKEKRPPFLAYFWGPIPWMIEAAAVTALVVQDWGDFSIIVGLLLFNAVLGFWEEHEASSALDALKNSLALEAPRCATVAGTKSTPPRSYRVT